MWALLVIASIFALWLLGYLAWNFGLGSLGPEARLYAKLTRLGWLGGIGRRSNQTPMEYAAHVGRLVPSAHDGASLIGLGLRRRALRLSGRRRRETDSGVRGMEGDQVQHGAPHLRTVRSQRAGATGMSARYYDVFETAKGWVGLLASESGIRRSALPCDTPDESILNLGPETNDALRDRAKLGDVPDMLTAYLEGEEVDFTNVALDFGDATEFYVSAWNACRAIPRGETRTYCVAGRTHGPSKRFPRGGTDNGQEPGSADRALPPGCRKRRQLEGIRKRKREARPQAMAAGHGERHLEAGHITVCRLRAEPPSLDGLNADRSRFGQHTLETVSQLVAGRPPGSRSTPAGICVPARLSRASPGRCLNTPGAASSRRPRTIWSLTGSSDSRILRVELAGHNRP